MSIFHAFQRAALGLILAHATLTSSAHAQRVLGLDVSAWQGNLSQATWNSFHDAEDRQFVFIRSSRGGTTGFYNQNNSSNTNPPGQNTLSQRYDDPYFVQNITRATTAGLFAGPYHFGRLDIVDSTPYADGKANTGLDEANHFLQMAGAWMRPGYMLPVFDLEAGDGDRTANEIAQFSIDFSDRIYEATGVRPVIYVNGNYSQVLQSASAALRTELVAAYPVLWDARYISNYASVIQTGNPKDSYAGFYGPWDDAPNPAHPWSFWQYTSSGSLQGYGGNLDLNVAKGGVDFLKDRLVPAMWTTNAGGSWNALANWNSGQTPTAPVQGPGQVARVGPLTLPATRLPGANDTVILDRPGAIAVTLDGGVHNIRKLFLRESLSLLQGASLTINYVPVAESTPLSAQFSAPISVSGGSSLSAHTMQLDAGQTLTVGGGGLSFNRLDLMPHSSTPGKIILSGDLSFTPLGGAAAAIARGAGTGANGQIDLGGGQRTITVADGAAAVDLTVTATLSNGGLTKAGPGTLALTLSNFYAGDTAVLGGKLSLATPSLSDLANVELATGSLLDLGFAGADSIGALFINGVSQLVGEWGAVGSGAQFTSPLLTGTGRLQVTSFQPLIGDFTLDGTVDGDDLTPWQAGFGLDSGAAWTQGDADFDGSVDGADLLAWQQNVAMPAATSAAASVPEPGAGMIACVLFGALVRGRRGFGRP